MINLKHTDNIYVDIDSWDYIPEIKSYGPFKKCLLNVRIIINLLNRGIRLVIPEKYHQTLYMIIKEYNIMAHGLLELKQEVTLADEAERHMEKLLKIDIEREKYDDRINNPLDDSTTKNESRLFESVDNLQSSIRKIIVQQKKRKEDKPKLSDMFTADVPIDESLYIKSFDKIELDV